MEHGKTNTTHRFYMLEETEMYNGMIFKGIQTVFQVSIE